MNQKAKSKEDNWFRENHIFCKWIRAKERIEFDRPKTFLHLGQRGSGKSSLLEVVATKYPKIIDLFGSRDNEGLAWCRSPLKDSVIFVVGDSVRISSEWPCVKISELKASDFKKYDVVTSVHAFYSTPEEEFVGLNRILDTLYRRTHWDQPWFLMVREAANFIYSRIKLTKNQYLAKADFIYLLREARHMGYAVGVDTIRWTAIDVEIRDVSDYTFIKSVGRKGLPPDLRFIYRYINPYDMMRMQPNQFVLVTDSGSIGVGTFKYPFWHKEEKEDLREKLKIEIDYGEVPNYGVERRNTVSDFEHEHIIEKYSQERSEKKVAVLVGRSSGTIHNHVVDHNEDIKGKGECRRCARIKSSFAQHLLT